MVQYELACLCRDWAVILRAGALPLMISDRLSMMSSEICQLVVDDSGIGPIWMSLRSRMRSSRVEMIQSRRVLYSLWSLETIRCRCYSLTRLASSSIRLFFDILVGNRRARWMFAGVWDGFSFLRCSTVWVVCSTGCPKFFLQLVLKQFFPQFFLNINFI